MIRYRLKKHIFGARESRRVTSQAPPPAAAATPPALTFVGLCWLSLALAGCHGPMLAIAGGPMLALAVVARC